MAEKRARAQEFAEGELNIQNCFRRFRHLSKTTRLIKPKTLPFLMQPFTIKYQPKKTSDIMGQDIALKKLKNFVVDFKKQRKNGGFR